MFILLLCWLWILLLYYNNARIFFQTSRKNSILTCIYVFLTSFNSDFSFHCFYRNFFGRIFWLTWKIWIYVMISVRLARQPIVHMWQKLWCHNFLGHYKTLHNGSFTHSYHFQWPWLYSKVTAVSNSFNWKFCVLIVLSWNFVWFLIMSSRWYIYHYFFIFCTY